MATQAEIEAAKEGLTADQIKWLGNADPTDPFIRARGGLPPLPNQVTVPGQSDVNTAEKYSRAETVGAVDDSRQTASSRSNSSSEINSTNFFIDEERKENLTRIDQERKEQLARLGIDSGGERLNPIPARAEILNKNGVKAKPDIRTKITVPEEYLNNNSAPGVQFLKRQFHGIIFPYTPLINYEYNANYSAQNPLHSNYTQNFYQRSSVSNIAIAGKFTVQNQKDAEIYLGTVHLLSILTKMKFGNDSFAGTPPPVCALDAYGTYMLKNVPIAITAFRVELPDSVDYYIYEDIKDATNVTAVPVLSTLNITCAIMYSRREIQNFSVDKFISSYAEQKKLGYL